MLNKKDMECVLWWVIHLRCAHIYNNIIWSNPTFYKGFKGNNRYKNKTITMMDGGTILIIAIWPTNHHHNHILSNPNLHLKAKNLPFKI